jgi:hypothetical protein
MVGELDVLSAATFQPGQGFTAEAKDWGNLQRLLFHLGLLQELSA